MTNTVNTKAIAGFLDTRIDQIAKVTEMIYVYCVTVTGFRPIFVSKAKLAIFIADDSKKYNTGLFLHTSSGAYVTRYGKAYGACPISNSPRVKAKNAELKAMWNKPSVSIGHHASAFFPSFAA